MIDMKGATVIPTGWLPVLPPDLDGSDPRRVTLIHKRKDVLACILSRGMEEVVYDKPVEDALLLKMYGRDRVSVGYQSKVTLRKRDVARGAYTVVETEDVFLDDNILKFKIPFFRSRDFISDFVKSGVNFDKTIDDFLTVSNARLVTYLEDIADNGLFHRRSKEVRRVREEYKEIGRRIYSQIDGLFHEEPDEVKVKKEDVRLKDKNIYDFMLDPRVLSTRAKYYFFGRTVVPILLSLFPSCTPDILAKKIRSKYEKRYNAIEDEEEKIAVALSQFALSNPKLLPGIKRAFLNLKALGNLGTYSAQLAANGYVLSSWSPWLSVPLTIPTVITGVTMLRNAVLSGGSDYSGVISSVINKIIVDKFDP